MSVVPTLETLSIARAPKLLNKKRLCPLGKICYERMVEKNWSQADLAFALSLSVVRVSDLLTKLTIPTPTTCIKLAAALDLDPLELFLTAAKETWALRDMDKSEQENMKRISSYSRKLDTLKYENGAMPLMEVRRFEEREAAYGTKNS